MKDNTTIRKPRIAVIGLKGFPAYGGSARAGENMMVYLKDRFHFVVFNTATHTHRESGVYNDVEQIVFSKFFISPLNTFYYYVKSLLYCLLKGDFDVVHVFHVDAAFIIPLLRIRYPVIAGHRASPRLAEKWSWMVKRYFHFMEWLFFKMPADVLTSVSMPVVRKFQSHTRRKILFIPNGIVFSPGEDLPPIQEQDYVLFASGRIIASKGCHIMLEALKKLNYKGRVLIIGNRAHNRDYSIKLEELSVGLDVHFIELIKEKPLLMAYLKNARVFVFPSFHEGMSNMLLEAASVKVPLVCSDIPENTQVFSPDETLYFKTGDENDLAEKLDWVFNHHDEAQAIAGRAYERLMRDYNWEKLSERYARLYLWLIENKKPLNRDDL